MNVHESELYTMRGAGIGSFFSSLFRGLIPLANNLFKVGTRAARSEAGQRVLSAAKRTAIDAGLDIAHDTLKGKNLKQAAKKHLANAGEKMVSVLDEEIVQRRRRGGQNPKKKKKRASPSPRKKKKKVKRVTKTVKRTRTTRVITRGKKKKSSNNKRSRQDLLGSWM